MVGLQFFLVRKDVEYYTLVVEGVKEDILVNLLLYFKEVRFIKTESIDYKFKSRYKGNRQIENGVIRGCWYTQDLRTMGKFSKPIEYETDPRWGESLECA